MLEVGVSPEQAEVHLQIVTELLETKLALKADVEKLRVDICHQFEKAELVLKSELKLLDKQMTIKLGLISAAVTPASLGLVAAIAKFVG